ncbi:hypothetical protein HYV86_04375 [Candidatus Woesearchaeota archaeon]|nr:hypothetical protein [Candidatus Woesearchaeota archaeon]
MVAKILKKSKVSKSNVSKTLIQSTLFHKRILICLSVVVFILLLLTVAKARGLFISTDPEPVIVGNTVDLDSFTLEQKIAQMTVSLWLPENMEVFRRMQLGGVHMFALESTDAFSTSIRKAQEGATIPFFITADAEGCISPFIHITNLTSASSVATLGEAYEKGFHDGEFMREMGFNVNFAPVVDLGDTIWRCRTFPGDEKQVAQFAQAYTQGLQAQGLIATAKHYPGKTLVVRDPHKFLVGAEIDEKDVYPYSYLAEHGTVKSIMVSHLITTGAVDSQGIPSVVSSKVIADLKQQYKGLIISDEIHMLGLKNFYPTVDEMYVAVFAAGNDIVLNFDKNPEELHRMISIVAAAVRDGRISESQIDASVRKVLEAKGLVVV